MNRPVLIVGGGPSGLSAAHALAAAGQRVVLVDKADQLGGAPILSGYAKLVPCGEWAKDAIGGMVKRDREPTNSSTSASNATVKTFVGAPGDFRATLSDGTQVSSASAAILCTGFTHFDSINKPEWGFGTYPDVVTTTQVEQMFSSGKGVRCPSDGREPERVAILLCVGSRDRQIGREWCSKICCTVSSNLAMEIREALPKCSVYIYYMDIRTFGLYEGHYYWESQEKHKVKYIKARIAEVTSDGKRLIVKGEDTLVKRPITIPFDMVVHAIGMDPNVDNMTLSAVFDVKLEKHGHIQKASTYSNMSATSRPGRLRRRRRDGTRDHRRLHRARPIGGDGGADSGPQRPAGGGRVMWAIGSHKAKAAPAPARPVLDLSGPKLRRAFENLVECRRGHRRRRALCRRAGAQGLAVRGGARQGPGRRADRARVLRSRRLHHPGAPAHRRLARPQRLCRHARPLGRAARRLVRSRLPPISGSTPLSPAFPPIASTAGRAISPPRCCTSPRPSAIR